jgi:ubiquinone/menaquinone biosynthesis C-methylase UbiE
MQKMSAEEAFQTLRRDPRYRDLIRDAYLDEDVSAAAARFELSGEFAEVRALMQRHLPGGVVLDLGAGNGIVSYALARAGAAKVIALEPDPSASIGRGAVERLCAGLPVATLDSFGEQIPLPDASVDAVYTRQVLHHTTDLPQVLRECYRITRPGGLFLACREHIVDDDAQMAEFLAKHPVHQLAGNENAYRLDEYTSAIASAGYQNLRVLRTYDSVINAFPAVRSQQELAALPEKRFRQAFGPLGGALAHIPPLRALYWRRLNRPVAGRMYTFVAYKPG